MDHTNSSQENMGYAFISYAHADSSKVLPILTTLQERGVRLWYDSGIEIGTEWPEYIARALHGSSCVLCFLSRNAVESDNCRREINFAIAQKKDILAIYLEEDFPRPLGIAMQLDSIQAVFLSRYATRDQFVQDLVSAKLLRKCLNGVQPTAKEPKMPITPVKPIAPVKPVTPQKPAQSLRHQPLLYAYWSKDCYKLTLLWTIFLYAIAMFYVVGSFAANHPGPALIVSLPIVVYITIFLAGEKGKIDEAATLRHKVTSEHQVICEGPASLVPEKTSSFSFGSNQFRKGWLFLTKNAILFYPLSFEDRHCVMSIPLADITKVECRSGNAGNLVLKATGGNNSFSVVFPKRWMQSIYDISL